MKHVNFTRPADFCCMQFDRRMLPFDPRLEFSPLIDTYGEGQCKLKYIVDAMEVMNAVTNWYEYSSMITRSGSLIQGLT